MVIYQALGLEPRYLWLFEGPETEYLTMEEREVEPRLAERLAEQMRLQGRTGDWSELQGRDERKDGLIQDAITKWLVEWEYELELGLQIKIVERWADDVKAHLSRQQLELDAR